MSVHKWVGKVRDQVAVGWRATLT